MKMEREKKPYAFVLFCSASIIKRLGVDFFVRMGISRVWIGVESKSNTHDKIKGIDLKALISELQSNGIEVMLNEALRYRPGLLPVMVFALNARTRMMVYDTVKLYRKTFGRPGISVRI